MLFLVFSLGDDRYAIDATLVVEVLPLVNWKSVPGAPRGVAGIIDYRGKPAPLLGLSVESATGTIRRNDKDFQRAGLKSEEAPYLGPIANTAEGSLQRIDIRY